MTIFRVSNTAQLQGALDRAVGGDRVILDKGSYGQVNLWQRNYSSNVTLQSASMTDRTHLDGLKISNSKNLTVVGLDLGRGLVDGEGTGTILNMVQNATNVTFADVQIHGSRDGIPGNDGLGLYVTGSSNVKVFSSQFEELGQGSFIQRSNNVAYFNNIVENIRTDGICVAATDNIQLRGNLFRNFHPNPLDHPDAIQFWNTNEKKGSSNITIRDNVILQDVTPGMGMQGIFLNNPGAYKYSNVLIQNNLLHVNGLWDGIFVNGGQDVQILGNSSLSRSGDRQDFRIRLIATNSALIKDNVADDILTYEGNSSVSMVNNWNLTKTPALRDLFADLDTPQALSDLVVLGVGFHPTSATPTRGFTAPRSAAGSPDDQASMQDWPQDVSVSNGGADPIVASDMPPGVPNGHFALLAPSLGSLFEHFALA